MKKLDWALLLGLVVCVALGVRLRPHPEQRNTMIFREMVYSKGFESYSENPYLPTGTTQQAPVPGTVHRGTRPHPEDAHEGGFPTAASAADTAEALARGEQLFTTFCTVCHGADGGGNGPVVLKGYPAPPSLATGNSRLMRDEELLQIVTTGRNNMPGYGAQIWREDRWKVVLWVRALQQKAPPAPTGAEPAEPGS